MSDKISNLNELTSPDNDDVVPVTDSSVPETKKITHANLFTNIDKADFTAVSHPSIQEGRLFYSSEYNVFCYFDDEGNLIKIGRGVTEQVRNTSGSDLNKGDIVKQVGASGDNPEVDLAQANTEDNAEVLGVVMDDSISDNSVGRIIIIGRVRDMDTSGFTEGSDLYLSPDTAGGLTETRPSDYPVKVGMVTRSHSTNGHIKIDIDREFTYEHGNEFHSTDYAEDPHSNTSHSTDLVGEAGVINAMTEKTEPVDDDELVLEDSEDSNNPKKVKFSNIGGGIEPSYQTITSTTNFDVSNMNLIEVEIVGGGGAGGPGGYWAGNGGAGGGYARKIIDVSAESSISVTIGAGGSGEGNTDTDVIGENGGTTKFGEDGVDSFYFEATGGKGGCYNNDYENLNETPNIGGEGSGGDFNSRGLPGDIIGDTVWSGGGGGSYFGGGGSPIEGGMSTFDIANGINGGGGAGGDSTENIAGDGGDGIVIVKVLA